MCVCNKQNCYLSRWTPCICVNCNLLDHSQVHVCSSSVHFGHCNTLFFILYSHSARFLHQIEPRPKLKLYAGNLIKHDFAPSPKLRTILAKRLLTKYGEIDGLLQMGIDESRHQSRMLSPTLDGGAIITSTCHQGDFAHSHKRPISGSTVHFF